MKGTEYKLNPFTRSRLKLYSSKTTWLLNFHMERAVSTTKNEWLQRLFINEVSYAERIWN